MGLFDKKFCAVCNNKAGLLAHKLNDGNYLCSKCYSRVFSIKTIENVSYYMEESTQFSLEDYNALVQMQEENLEELKNFECTSSYCGTIHFDEIAGEVLFVEEKYIKKPEELYKLNPPVFKLENLIYHYARMSEPESSTTLTGKAQAQSNWNLLVAFNDPLFTFCNIHLGKVTAKENMFGNIKLKGIDEVDSFLEKLRELEHDAYWRADEDDPIANSDLYWRTVSRDLKRGLLTKPDVTVMLKNWCEKDRKLLHRIKKEYNL